MYAAAAEIGLSVIRKITDLWLKEKINNTAAMKADSLVEYTKVARVEPIVLIDTDCLYVESLPDIQQSLLSIFAGYYLQAIAISTNIGKINVIRHLDRLNPNRNVGDSATSTGFLLAEESYKDKLPTFGQESIGTIVADYEKADETDLSSGTNIRDASKELKELSNLSVGKMFNVEITDGTAKATLPIAIRLMASSLPSASITHILSVDSQDNSLKERYHAWKAGRIEFIKDLVFCQDLIDAHRKELMTDKDGIYSSLIARNRSNQISSIVSMNPSIATASNIVIMSDTTADKLEATINGKLRDFKTREAVMKKTSLMLMVIIEKQWNRITIYTRSLNLPMELSASDIKTASKGNGPDISEIIKAYSLGMPPTL
jgi:hypothetical protein